MNARTLVIATVLLTTAGTAAAGEFGWPVEIDTAEAVITVYQPQPEAMTGNTVDSRAAVSVKMKSGGEPAFGVVWATATFDVDRDERTARVLAVDVTRVRFPDATREQEEQLAAVLETEVPNWELTMSLDQLAAGLAVAEKEQAYTGKLKTEAPRIVFSTEPAILLLLDGPPQLRPIEGTRFKRVVNTAFPIVFDSGSGAYYLYGTSVWFSAPDVVEGPWQTIERPPKAVVELFKEAEQAAAEGDEPEGEPADLRRAKIVVSTTPAELIVADGAPRFEPIGNGELLTLSNSESHVFVEVASQHYYVVLSGRWYRSRSLERGPWKHVAPEDLPKAFATISPESERGEVRAHVAGTDEANDALADAYVPQTSAINRKEAKIEVVYDGAPKFARIEGTDLEYAVNTGTQVLKTGNQYFACEQGVWYYATSPTGPWSVADERPTGVDDIPPSSPAYNTKYVYVYDSTPEVVYVGYLPGYMGCYPYRGTVVYGTGWYYPAWIGPTYYYPRPSTWGFHVTYNPWTGWGFGMSWSAGWYRFSWGWAGGGWYGPGWGGAWHSGYHAGWNAGYWAGWHAANNWYGPGGYRPGQINVGSINVGQVNVNRPGQRPVRPQTRENLYGRPQNLDKVATRDMIAKNPPRPAVSRPATRPGTGTTTRPATGAGTTRPSTRPATGAGATAPATRPATVPSKQPRPAPGVPNDVLADRDGNVYRKTPDGWETRDKAGWTKTGVPTTRPATGGATTKPSTRPSTGTGPTKPSTKPAKPSQTRPSIDRDWGARQRGQARVQSRPQGTAPRGSVARSGGGVPRARR